MSDNKFFNDTILAAIDKVIVASIALLSIPVGIRYLGEDLFGLYLVLNMFTLTGVLSLLDLGIGTGVQYYVGTHKDDVNKLQNVVFSSFILFASMALLFTPLFYYSIPWIIDFIDTDIKPSQTIRQYLTLLSLGLFLQFFILLLYSFFVGLAKFYDIYRLNIIYTLAQNVTFMICFILTQDLQYVFYCYLIIIFVRLLHMLTLLPKNLYNVKAVDFVFLKDLGKYSIYIFFNRIVGIVNKQIDRLLIIDFLSIKWMTIYEAIVKLISPVNQITQVMYSALFPEITKLYSEKKYDDIKSIYLKLLRYTYLLILPMCLFLFCAVEFILRLWVGEDFVQYANISKILIATSLILPIVNITSIAISGINAVQATFFHTLTATVINVLFSYMLVLRFGIAGLLIATFMSTLYLQYTYVKVLEKQLDLQLQVLAIISKIFLYHLFGIIYALCVIVFVKSLYLQVSLILVGVVLQYVLNFKYGLHNKEKKIVMVQIGRYVKLILAKGKR